MTRLLPLLAVLLTPLVALAPGCKQDENKPAEQKHTEPVGGEDSSTSRSSEEESPVLASSGPYSITLEDFRRSLARARLSGTEIPKKTLADPAFQRSRARRLVMRQVVRAEAKARDIEISHTDLRSAIVRHPGLGDFEHLDDKTLVAKVENDLGIDADTFWHLMEEDALVQAMTNNLLSGIDDEELKERYWRSKSKIELRVIRILNVPTPAEISRFIAENEDRIQRYYQEHRNDYRKPPRATVRRFELAVPADATEEEQEVLRAQAEKLRQKAITGDFGEIAEQYSTDVLSANKGGSLPPVTERVMPLAFELELGEVSQVQTSRRGFWFIELERRYPALDRSLDAPLKREIASKLIQRDGASPTLLAKASRALQALRSDQPEALEKALEDARVDRFEIPLFSDSGSGRIPRLGKVPRVLEAAFALEAEGDVVETPILDSGYLYLVELVGRQTPDPIRFKAEKDVFRTQVLEAERPRILWDFVNQKLEESIQVDIRALQQEFGVLQSDGTIQRLNSAEKSEPNEGAQEQSPNPG